MAAKLTGPGHAARKKIQTLLRSDNAFHGTERRFAYAESAHGDFVIAISGQPGIQLACEQYGVQLDSEHARQRLNGVLQGLGFEQALVRPPDVCAEAHLWMTLDLLHSRSAREGLPPRHLHQPPHLLQIWVYELTRKSALKEDSPCGNCRQWVRKVFLKVNGT